MGGNVTYSIFREEDSGHGGNREGPLWGNEDAQQYFGTKRIRDIVEQMGGNAFARTFRRQIETKHDITIYDLYRELFKTTRGSHVSIYNQQQYGSVYTETMAEFLPE